MSALRNGGGRGIRTPKGLAARWISSPLPCQLRLALRAHRVAQLYAIRARTGGCRVSIVHVAFMFCDAVSLLRTGGRRNQSLDRRPQVARAQVTVSLDHREGSPAAQLLERP